MDLNLNKFSDETLASIRKKVLAEKSAREPRPWETLPEGNGGARPKQLPPDHPRHHEPWISPRTGKVYRCSDGNPHCTGVSPDWSVWLFLAGRGSGKTMAGAQWVIQMALSEPGVKIGVIAPTYSAVQQVCFEGDSGIRAQLLPGEEVSYNKNNLTIVLRNGSIIQGFTAEQEKGIRGSNLYACWFDEFAYMPDPHFYTHGLQPALRIPRNGKEPKLFITTTPLVGMKALRELLDRSAADPEHVHVTRAGSGENITLSKRWLEDLQGRFKGTILERQELEGEMIDDIDGALFRVQDFSENRVDPRDLPEFRRVVIAMDPATTSTEASDETGIIVAAEGPGHQYYVLADHSMRGNPSRCMQVVAGLYWEYGASMVVGEAQVIGDYMTEALAQIDPNVFFKKVTAMKSKHVRAVPVANVAMQKRIHMVGFFEELEKQLLAMTPDSDRSKAHDDRADAFVWALTELIGQHGGSYLEVYGFEECAACGGRINIKLEKKCRHCGELIPEKPPAVNRSHGNDWSVAYQKTCENGHMFSMTKQACPQCEEDPGLYLAAISRFGGSNVPVRGYTGSRDWLTGRRI